ncbi:MAG: hypothetical protein KF767_13355 [Bdellovibrionaceae bacterium]|nr:hypothetical protein [Pseudobdellovibrionaceae bacterium]
MRFLIPLLFTIAAQAQTLRTDYSMGNYGYKPGSSMNVETLVNVLKKGDARDVPTALRLFKAAAPEYFENFVLIYRSQSLQESSFQAPRVLLFDPSGELVVTFNGHPQHRGYGKLELMQFRGDTMKFEFREIDFTPNGPKLSDANPKTCLQCHQSAARAGVDPRPNWEPYNVWPGAYGSESGRLWPRNSYEANKFRGDDRIMVEEQPRERAELTRFWNVTRPADERYALLETPKKARTAKGVDFDEIAHQSVSFTDILSNLSLRRMVRLAQTDNPAAYARVKHNLVHLYRCDNLALADEDRLGLVARVNAQGIFRITTEKVQPPPYGAGGPSEDGYNRADGDYRLVTPPARWEHSFSEQLTLLFESQGVSTLDWSTDFGTRGRFAFTERFGRPSNLRVMRFLAEEQEFELGKMSCDELKPLAEAEGLKFAAWLKTYNVPAEAIRPAANPQALLARCASCHTDVASSEAPWIPFDQPAALSRVLREGRAASGRPLWDEMQYRLSDHARLTDQMPPALRRPEPEDRQALLRYLNQLRER